MGLIFGVNVLFRGIVDMEKESRLFPKRLKEHGLSRLLKARKQRIFQIKRRFDYVKNLLARHEEMTRAHHKLHYGKEKLKWEWGTIDHLGVWAFGGNDKEKLPTLKDVYIQVPKQLSEKVSGWYCYVGPIPEFEEN